MSTYINMDRNLLKKGGRNAYQMSLDDFKTLLDEAVKRFDDDYDVSWQSGDEADALRERLLHEAIAESHYEEGLAPFEKASKDLEKIFMDYENVLLEGIFVADNGIPTAQLIIGGDWEAPVQAFLYYDGKAFRGYVPTYGNTFNRYCKCALRSEGENGEPLKIYGKKYFVQSDDPRIRAFLKEGQELPWEEPAVIVPTKDNYDELRTMDVTPCTKACLEDFCSRVVSKGPLPKEMFDKGLAALQKISAIPLYDDEEDDEEE